jgi:hypothetical protein
MFAAGSTAIDSDYPRPGLVAGENAAIEDFIYFSAFKPNDAYVAFLAAGR